MKIINVHIKNEELDIETDFKFSQEFNLITGSNGSGKSILLGMILYGFMGKKSINAYSDLCKAGAVKIKYESRGY